MGSICATNSGREREKRAKFWAVRGRAVLERAVQGRRHTQHHTQHTQLGQFNFGANFARTISTSVNLISANFKMFYIGSFWVFSFGQSGVFFLRILA